MNYFVIILAIIGVLLFAIAAYYVYMRIQSNVPTQHAWPPTQYMKQVGVHCPDMWEAIESPESDQNVRCVNPYATVTDVNNTCYDPNGPDPSTKMFYKDFPKWTTTFDSWPMSGEMRKKASDYTARKQWLTHNHYCNHKIAWQGF